MQYKDATKIIFDKRKLDILIRLGCPDSQLLEIIKTGTFTPTGDKLIDDTLECLIDVKNFSNWGGKRKGAGRHKKNQDESQLEYQDENQLENQDAIQVVDKDIERDKDKDSICSRYNDKFKTFIQEYPKKVNEDDYKYFVEALKKVSFNELIESVKNYAIYVEYEGIKEKYVKSAKNWLYGKHWEEYRGYNPYKVEGFK